METTSAIPGSPGPHRCPDRSPNQRQIVREVEAVGPRRKLQLALVLVAAVVVGLALTGAVGPASVEPVPTAVVTR
jgi:hypothetical protein